MTETSEFADVPPTAPTAPADPLGRERALDVGIRPLRGPGPAGSGAGTDELLAEGGAEG
ncbi:hypothetical protein ACIQJT_28555 [Streptomyces sp. NPDC091972]|uniref:hypothetical protein n=1 Tax=Streptomyces sp. NPDC091972 TaxID=3366007 RepID=UPI0037F5587F